MGFRLNLNEAVKRRQESPISIDTGPLDPAEYRAIDQQLVPHWRTFYRLLWHLGIRVSEGLAITVADLTSSGVVVGRLKKSEDAREELPLPRWLLDELKAQAPLRKSRRVFPYTRQAAHAALLKAARAAGLSRRVHPHNYRHAFGRRALLLKLGGSELDHKQLVAGLMGHSSTRYVDRYGRPGKPEIEAAWRRLHASP